MFTAKITIDNELKLVGEGQSVRILICSMHRIENLGKKKMVLIEVLIGSYFRENYIVGYEDRYDRKK